MKPLSEIMTKYPNIKKIKICPEENILYTIEGKIFSMDIMSYETIRLKDNAKSFINNYRFYNKEKTIMTGSITDMSPNIPEAIEKIITMYQDLNKTYEP